MSTSSFSRETVPMPLYLHACAAWLRQHLPWSNSPRAWAERAAALFLLAGLIALLVLAPALSAAQRAAGAGLLLLAFAVLLRRGWVTLFGPLLFYDLVRTGRRRRNVLVRCLYALLLLLLLACVYAMRFLGRLEYAFQGAPLPARELADFAASFAYAFLVVQLLAVFLLTPAYVAGILVEEKERRTLDALLATDLRNREIVFGVLLARLANLTLVLLTGLPFLSVLQFMGGVEPNLVLAGFAFAGLTMVSLGSLSIVLSLYAPRPRDAIVRTYVVVLAYLVGSGVLWALTRAPLPFGTFPSTAAWVSPVTVQDLADWLSAGNVVIVAVDLAQKVFRGKVLAALLFDALVDYAWFHGLVAAGCCAWAVVRLRARVLEAETVPARPTAKAPPQASAAARRVPPTRPVGDRPMRWKELVVESGGRRGLLGSFVAGVALAGVLWPAVQIFYFFDRFWPVSRDDLLSDATNLWVRIMTVLLGCGMLLQVAFRAAGSVSGERDRQTLDGLLATPLTNRAILAAKWRRSALGGRGPWGCLALVWLLGWLAGGLHPLAVPCLVLTWLVFAVFLAGLGLWFSVASRSARHATFLTLLAVLVVMAAAVLAANDVVDVWLPPLEAYFLLPPVAFFALASSPQNVHDIGHELWAPARLAIPAELLLWVLAALVLWKLANVRFQVVTGRAPEDEPKPTASPAREDGSRFRWASLLPRRRRLAHVAVLLLPLGLLLGGYAYLFRAADETLQEAFAAVDKTDPGWRLEDVEAGRKVVPPERNGGLVAIRVKERVRSLTAGGNWPGPGFEELKLDEVPAERRFRAEQASALRAELARVAAALPEARRLKDFPEGRLPIDWADDGISTRLQHTQDCREIGNLLHLDAWLRAEDGDADGALESCRAALNAGRAVGDEPTLISQLVHIALQTISCRTAERVLAQGEPGEAGLLELQRLLEDEARQPMLLVGMRGERAALDRTMNALQNGNMEVLWSLTGDRPKRVGLVPWRPQELLILLVGSLKTQRAALLELFTQHVEAARLPPEQQAAAFGRVTTPTLSSPIMMRLLFPATGKVGQAVDRARAELRCAAAALALERYRRRHGRWPATLKELVPEYLADVPADPYDGKPLRYVRLRTGEWVVYSIGPDGKDDGGTLNRTNPYASGADLGFRLWDPPQRRQPPLPPAVDPPAGQDP